MEPRKASLFRNPNNRVGRTMTVTAAVAGSFALLAGCGGKSSTTESTPASASNTANNEPTLVFDDLGGGSSVIEVFPSPNTRHYNGTFYDGDAVQAICKAQGREVHSDPSVGELNRQSDEWIRIHGSPGESQYATAVYVEHPARLLHKLPEC